MPWIGYTELRTDRPEGRHANVRTMRAVVVRADGSGRRVVGEGLIDGPDSWTQFAGWSPDGSQAVVTRGWQDPENAAWEERNKTFRMEPGRWLLDSCLVDLASGSMTNLTAVDRVSHYNGGLFFLPDGRTLGFTPLIGGNSRPYQMDVDGRNKRDVSGTQAGFAYGYSASPDGHYISYHENYQIYVARADGSGKRRIETGNPFNFAPSWSADSQWLLFVSGQRGSSHPFIVRPDGSGLRKIADLNGYQGWILFLDVPDFHEGSSDVPVWAVDGQSVFYTAKVGENVELFQVGLDGNRIQLTRSPPGSLHYHPQPSPDGKFLSYGSMRDGVRQLYVLRLSDRSERQITHLARGNAAMWASWQKVAAQLPSPEDGKLSILVEGSLESEMAPHQSGNVYAPDMHRDGDRWLMWYGAQGRDGHDRIHLAVSTNGMIWQKRGVVLDCGSANHVNDPSVVRAGDQWWMFYTVAEKAEMDEIAAATSKDGVRWEKLGVVLRVGPGARWDSFKVGRPSVLFEKGRFRMWYDGQATETAAKEGELAATVRREGRAVGYAESIDGLQWNKAEAPVFHEGSGAVHVCRHGKDYLMVIESGNGVRWAASPDGIRWTSRGQLRGLSGTPFDGFGHVTPFLSIENGKARLLVGAAGRKTWDGNRIGAFWINLPGPQ